VEGRITDATQSPPEVETGDAIPRDIRKTASGRRECRPGSTSADAVQCVNSSLVELPFSTAVEIARYPSWASAILKLTALRGFQRHQSCSRFRSIEISHSSIP
jgi:hypothetical protein